MPEHPAAKKGKGKACIRVSTSFNPLDQTCIHPESYHVAQRYRIHKSKMHFKESSCILTYKNSCFPVFSHAIISIPTSTFQLDAALGRMKWGAYSPRIEMMCPHPTDPSMFELRWGRFGLFPRVLVIQEKWGLGPLTQNAPSLSLSLSLTRAPFFSACVCVCLHMCMKEGGGALSCSCSHSTVFSLHKFWQ